MKRHAAPIIAAILLLLPILYVASYLALVTPGSPRLVLGSYNGPGPAPDLSKLRSKSFPYRFDSEWAQWFYWPLERMDRKIRPRAWSQTWSKIGLEKQGGGLMLLSGKPIHFAP